MCTYTFWRRRKNARNGGGGGQASSYPKPWLPTSLVPSLLLSPWILHLSNVWPLGLILHVRLACWTRQFQFLMHWKFTPCTGHVFFQTLERSTGADGSWHCLLCDINSGSGGDILHTKGTDQPWQPPGPQAHHWNRWTFLTFRSNPCTSPAIPHSHLLRGFCFLNNLEHTSFSHASFLLSVPFPLTGMFCLLLL